MKYEMSFFEMPFYETSFLWNVLSTVYEMSVLWNVSLKCLPTKCPNTKDIFEVFSEVSSLVGNPVPVRWIPSCTIPPDIILIHRLQDPGLQVLRHSVILWVVKFTLIYRFRTPVPDLYSSYRLNQGISARKVISEVHAFFVLQCTVFGLKSKHKTDITAWHGINFHKNNLWNILVIGNYCELSKLNAGFNMYAAEYTRPQLTFLALVPWVKHWNLLETYFFRECN